MESWELTDEEIKAVLDTWVYRGDSLTKGSTHFRCRLLSDRSREHHRAIANAAGKKGYEAGLSDGRRQCLRELWDLTNSMEAQK